MKRRLLKDIKKVIVHCSDSDYKSHDNAATIRKWHLARGWEDIGYHYVICKQRNGLIQCGRDLALVGAHCKGHNADSIGICLTGKNIFSKQQFDSLNTLMNAITMSNLFCRGDQIKVYPHHYFNKDKTCPNFSAWTKKNLKDTERLEEDKLFSPLDLYFDKNKLEQIDITKGA